MKQYDFDENIERHKTNCVKYDLLKEMYGRDDLLPMWVADMDFRSPDFVMDSIRERCRHEVLGYGVPSKGYYEALTKWLANHYGIHATKSDLHFIPGIVAGISYAILCLTEPGDKIMVTTPVYPPFLNLPVAAGRTVQSSPLRIVESEDSGRSRFAIDFDDFEQRIKGCRMFILSNPHNPAGTVWGKETLCRIADICSRNNAIVISDEIHADLTLPGHQHVSYSIVNETARNHSITFMAPSKTFNIAGLGSSTCYIANPELRQRFFAWLDGLGVAGGNIFAFTAAEAAFAHGEEWRQQMLQYIKGNVETLQEFIAKRMPGVKAVLPEASYLAWLDFSSLGLSHKEISERLIGHARVALNDGTTFGGERYTCCFRINIGCPKATLLEGLERIADAF